MKIDIFTCKTCGEWTVAQHETRPNTWRQNGLTTRCRKCCELTAHTYHTKETAP